MNITQEQIDIYEIVRGWILSVNAHQYPHFSTQMLAYENLYTNIVPFHFSPSDNPLRIKLNELLRMMIDGDIENSDGSPEWVNRLICEVENQKKISNQKSNQNAINQN